MGVLIYMKRRALCQGHEGTQKILLEIDFENIKNHSYFDFVFKILCNVSYHNIFHIGFCNLNMPQDDAIKSTSTCSES